MKHLFAIIGIAILILSCPQRVNADLTINVIAVNASEKDFREQEIKYHLPKELEPDAILDSGELKIDYDVDKGTYYAYGTFQFQPKETKTFKIQVKDIWVIRKEEIEVLKQQLDETLGLLEKDEEKRDIIPKARTARDKIFRQLDFILAQQEHYSENIDRRVEEYRAYKSQLQAIREQVFDEHYLDSEAPAEVDIKADKTVRFVIQVRNPTLNSEKLVVHRHYLPEEVRAEHVVDSKDFEVRFDDEKDRAYLTKEETFRPGEQKIYEILIKDIWTFPIKKVEPVLDRAHTAVEELQSSAMFADGAQFLLERIQYKIQQINDSQTTDLTIRKAIGIYRVNEKRYQDAKDDLEKLEKMVAILRMKQLAELEEGQVKNVLQRMKALRGLAQLSEAIFKKGISVTMTWRIIMGTLLFVAFFTALHFFIWAKRSKTMGEEHGPGVDEEVKVVPKPGEAGEAVETA